jgi:hypothetical protein
LFTDCGVTLTVDADTPMSAVGAAAAASDDGAVVCRSLLNAVDRGCWDATMVDGKVTSTPEDPFVVYMNV